MMMTGVSIVSVVFADGKPLDAELDATRTELEAQQQAQKRATRELESVDIEVSQLAQRVASVQAELRAIRQRRDAAAARAVDLRASLQRLEDRQREHLDRLELLLVRDWQQSRAPVGSVANTLMTGVALGSASHDAHLERRVGAAIDQQLERQLSELDVLREIAAALEHALDDLNLAERDLRRLLPTLDARQRELEQRQATAEDLIRRAGLEAQRLERQKNELEAAIRARSALPPPQQTLHDAGYASFAETRGHLPPPVEARILNDFQSVRDERLGSRWTGVVFADPPDEIVRAVYPGEVVHVQWITGMGTVVIVQHDEHHISLYANIGEAVVEAGTRLAGGDRVGRAAGGPRAPGIGGIYFEIRERGIPLNPATWIASMR